MQNQSTIFLETEADNWYARNKVKFSQDIHNGANFPEINWIYNTLSTSQNDINSILEIGCSSGLKLKNMCQLFSSSGSGIDPSQQAVLDGNSMLNTNQMIKLSHGSATNLPFESSSFDLVYFGFCLYLIDRADLLIAISEADRVLRRNGFLVITDFDPKQAYKKEYIHKQNIYSFKQDYSKCFLASELYSMVAKQSFSHTQFSFEINEDERVSTVILYKDHTYKG